MALTAEHADDVTQHLHRLIGQVIEAAGPTGEEACRLGNLRVQLLIQAHDLALTARPPVVPRDPA
jgi:hypothetical protein